MAAVWLSTCLKFGALSCSYARLLASNLQRPDVLHVSTSYSAACELSVKVVGYASTREFAVNAGSVKAAGSIREHKRSSARLRGYYGIIGWRFKVNPWG